MLQVMAVGHLLVASLGPYHLDSMVCLVRLVSSMVHLVSLLAMVEGDNQAHSLPHNIIWVLDLELMDLQVQDPRVGFLHIMVVPQAALGLAIAWDLIKAQEQVVPQEHHRWDLGLVLVDNLDMGCQQTNRVGNTI